MKYKKIIIILFLLVMGISIVISKQTDACKGQAILFSSSCLSSQASSFINNLGGMVGLK